ncbi:MAG: flagellar protein FlaG [Deltaproteobacteria bacterium]|nr:flagellar protein FlaG [Deltaproteobacteria bacterium]
MKTADLPTGLRAPRLEEITRLQRLHRDEVRPHGLAPPTSEVDREEVAVKPTSPPSGAELEEALTTVNQHQQVVQQSLQFEVDADLDRTVVKLVDSKTGEVVRQIPSEELVAIAKRLKDSGKPPAGLLFETEV